MKVLIIYTDGDFEIINFYNDNIETVYNDLSAYHSDKNILEIKFKS